MSRRWKTAQGVDPTILEQARLSSICAWCGNSIPLDAPVLTLGMKMPEGVDVRHLEGKFAEMPLPSGGKNVVALVTQQGSPAKKEGKDLMFMACGNECAQALREALNIQD